MVGGQGHTPAALHPSKRLDTHHVGGWVNPRAAGQMWKISPPPGFDLRTLQPVANRIAGGTRNNRKR